jgi:hypothetical protein
MQAEESLAELSVKRQTASKTGVLASKTKSSGALLYLIGATGLDVCVISVRLYRFAPASW